MLFVSASVGLWSAGGVCVSENRIIGPMSLEAAGPPLPAGFFAFPVLPESEG